MFNPGDYVIGKDRSYKRSIYRVVQVHGDRFDLQFICLDGRLGRSGDKSPNRLNCHFELATPEEVNKEIGYALSWYLIGFVRELLLTRSYQDQL